MNTKLSSLRVEKNWTQDYVAEKIGISQPAYSKLEQGQIKLTIDRAGQLAALYEIDPEYFFASDSPVVNFNDNSKNETLLQNVTNYNSELQKEFYEKLIQEKDKQIELQRTRIEKLELQIDNFVEKLAGKL